MKTFFFLPSIHNVHWNVNILSDMHKLEDKHKEPHFTTELLPSTNRSEMLVQTHQMAALLVVPLGTRVAKGHKFFRLPYPLTPVLARPTPREESCSVLRWFSDSKQE